MLSSLTPSTLSQSLPHLLRQLSAGLALSCLVATTPYAQTPSEFRLLDLTLVNTNRDDIASKILKWDGLVKTPEFGDIMSTELISARVDELKAQNDQLRLPTILRFYPRGILREVYRIDFYYQDYEQFAGLRILYRPFHEHYANKPQGLDIETVLKQITPLIGTPTTRVRRTVVGLPAYYAYHWEDDAVSILLDRESQQPGRPIMLQINVKNTSMNHQYPILLD